MQTYQPPHNDEAELAVLGAILIDPPYAILATTELRTEYFHNRKYSIIYSAMLSVAAENGTVDYLTLSNYLHNHGDLETIGGAAFLATLINYVPSALEAGNYAQIIIRDYKRRGIIDTGSNIVNQAIGDTDIDVIIDKGITQLRKFGEGGRIPKLPMAGAESVIIKAAYYKAHPLHLGEVRGIDTGWVDVNVCTGGWQRGYVTYWLGEPHIGKTWTMLNILGNICAAGGSAGLFSLEMSADTDPNAYDKTTLWERIILSRAKIRTTSYLSGTLTDAEQENLNATADEVSRWNFWIEDEIHDFAKIAATIHSRNRIRKLDVVAIDYLKLINYQSRAETVNDQMGELCRAIKRLAEEADISLHIPHQISDKKKQVAAKENKKPELADAYGTGHLSQDADVVLGLYRPPDQPNIMQCEILKDRPSGHAGLSWNWFIHNTWCYLPVVRG